MRPRRGVERQVQVLRRQREREVRIERVVLDPELGRELSRGALRTIAESHSSWEKAFSEVFEFLADPSRR